MTRMLFACVLMIGISSFPQLPAEEPPQETRTTVEFLRASEQPKEGWTKVEWVDPDQEQKQATLYYLEPTADVTQADIESASVKNLKFQNRAIALKLTENGGRKMKALTQSHLDQPLAIRVNGNILAVPIVRDAVERHLVLSGNFTEEEAESIVKGLQPQE